tara:strand:- start:36 stop:341 length:306 start_codon:yes stop_codon:yes gene_type:complete
VILGEGLGDGLGVSVADGLGEGLGVSVADGLGEGLGVSVGLVVIDGDGVGVRSSTPPVPHPVVRIYSSASFSSLSMLPITNSGIVNSRRFSASVPAFKTII